MTLIHSLWAFVVTDERGVEGVLRRITPMGTQPMIADSAERLEQFREDAEELARQMQLPLGIARFERTLGVAAASLAGEDAESIGVASKRTASADWSDREVRP